LAEGPESTAHTQRIAQATHCPNKQLQKIVQPALQRQCLKLKRSEVQLSHNPLPCCGFQIQTHEQLRFCASGSHDMPDCGLKDYYKITIGFRQK